MSLCYGNITRVVVSGVSVTLRGQCRDVCYWPDTKFCGSVTHHRLGAIRANIVLKEINSSNQRNTHTLLPYRYTGTRTEDISLHTHSNITHKQRFQGNVNRDLNVLLHLKENAQVRNPGSTSIYVCAYICKICVCVCVCFALWVAACHRSGAIQSACQIISWMVSNLSTDTLTESRAHHLSGGGATVGARCDWKTSLTLLWTSLCFPPTLSLLSLPLDT